MMIELKKEPDSLFTSIVADDFSGLKESLMKKKEGLYVLFKTVDGHLEQSAALKAELDYRASMGRTAFITYNISDEAYHYLLAYIDSFKLKGYDKRYGGINMPRTGEGAGCSAFSASFLELINALTAEDSLNWQIKVNVPQKLLGGKSGKQKVSLRRLFFSYHWARSGAPCRQLILFDPQLMYDWIDKIWDDNQSGTNSKYKLKMIGNSKGLEIDCRNCSLQTPMFKTVCNNGAVTTAKQ